MMCVRTNAAVAVDAARCPRLFEGRGKSADEPSRASSRRFVVVVRLPEVVFCIRTNRSSWYFKRGYVLVLFPR